MNDTLFASSFPNASNVLQRRLRRLSSSKILPSSKSNFVSTFDSRAPTALLKASIRRQRRLHRFPRSLHQLHVQAQRLQLPDQNVKAFRDPGLRRSLALDDRFVNLRATVYVIGFRSEQFL